MRRPTGTLGLDANEVTALHPCALSALARENRSNNGAAYITDRFEES